MNGTDPSGTFGLFGGCPAGSPCTSTDPGASNAAAASGRNGRQQQAWYQDQQQDHQGQPQQQQPAQTSTDNFKIAQEGPFLDPLLEGGAKLGENDPLFDEFLRNGRVPGAERGLPPESLQPPGEGPFRPGPASRPSEAGQGGKSLYDPKGGEWRWFPGDKYHNPHWDYKPDGSPNIPWQNVPWNGIKPVIS